MITFANHADKAPIEMQLKGDWFDRSATIKMGDRPVAQIQRSFMNVREIFGSKQTVSGITIVDVIIMEADFAM